MSTTYIESQIPFQDIDVTTLMICYRDASGKTNTIRCMPELGTGLELDADGKLRVADDYITDTVKGLKEKVAQISTDISDISCFYMGGLSGDLSVLRISSDTISSCLSDLYIGVSQVSNKISALSNVNLQYLSDMISAMDISSSYLSGKYIDLSSAKDSISGYISAVILSSRVLSGNVKDLSTVHIQYISAQVSSLQLSDQFISNDICAYLSTRNKLSTDLTALSGGLSAISCVHIYNISNEVSTLQLSDYQISGDLKGLSSDLSKASVDLSGLLRQERKIAGMSALDYYAYIGDNINVISADPRLSAISSDVIWFDTKNDDNMHPIQTLKRMDNLQAQIYRLGLQVRDVAKILENGVIPGSAYDNTKQDLIDVADMVQPPEEVADPTLSLLGMSIYGNYWCQNKQLYYIMFNPAGFTPTTTNFRWIISDHDDGNDSRKTVTYLSSDDKVYSLIYQMDQKVLSSVYQMNMSAAIYTNGTPAVYSDDQEKINSVISVLSAHDMVQNKMYISSDYLDEVLDQYIQSEEFDFEMIPDETVYSEPSVQILGQTYIDHENTQLYYCSVNGKIQNFPLNVNTDWYFLSTDTKTHTTVKSDTLRRIAYNSDKDTTDYGYVTFKILHGTGTPVCQVSTYYEDCNLTAVKDISVDLYVESNYDNQISAVKHVVGIGGRKPNTSLVEPTVKAICAKVDKKINFVEKSTSLYSGELVFFSDTYQLAVWDGSQFRVLNSSESSGLSKEEIQDIGLDYLDFQITDSSTIFNKLKIDSDGKLNIVSKETSETKQQQSWDNGDTSKVWVSGKLQIGKIYCGGKEVTRKQVIARTYRPKSYISHNFVEIVNASDDDIALDRVYLMYHTTDSNFQPTESQSLSPAGWEFLKLDGIIKAGGTYLVRGACCNPFSSAVMNIDSCDIEWRKRKSSDKDILNGEYSAHSRSGSLMEFSQTNGSFFLCYATDNADGTDFGNNIVNVVNGTKPTDLANNGTTDIEKAGYIDLVGLKSTSASPAYSENKPYSSATSTFENQLFYQWYYMDPAKQGNKAYSDRSNATMMTSIDMTRYAKIYKNGKRNNYYYSDQQKMSFKPGTTMSNNGIFSGKTTFNQNKPNIINVTFGIQATYKDEDHKASRCFSWVSFGYYDEYIKYRTIVRNAKGTIIEYGDWSEEKYSITSETIDPVVSGDGYDFHDFYDRCRWVASDGSDVTTHKVVLHNEFEPGEYQFRIFRDGDDSYYSDLRTFRVYSDDEVNEFSFIQTTDQQGFNWIEYQAWKTACQALTDKEDDFNFTINTGDIAQSGNRVNEWLDYDSGKNDVFRSKEEMFTIGNNDLCGSPEYVLGDGNDKTSKFNLINIQHYYTFELDTSNKYYTAFNGKNYLLYSTYSFNYGKWHFISIASEIRSEYALTFPEIDSTESGNSAFAKALNAGIENWLLRDLQVYMEQSGETDCQRCIVYMHEMPFTMVTPEFFDLSDSKSGTLGRTTAKTGCKLNLQNANGDYRFSRIFRKYGIRLIMGGHKHTFTLSTPLYDAGDTLIPDSSITDISKINDDKFISDNVDYIKSRKPVVEMPITGVRRLVTSKIADVTDETLLGYMGVLSGTAPIEKSVFFDNLSNLVIQSHDQELDIFDSLNTYNTVLSNFLRIEYVDEISAPTYSMSQATGYKVVSNKELPCPVEASVDPRKVCRYTPWLMSYCAALDATNISSGQDQNWSCTKNPVQCRPAYIRYDLDNDNISVTIKEVNGIYNITKDGKNPSYDKYNLNNQSTPLSCIPMTFGKFGKEHGLNYFEPSVLDDYMIIYSDYIKDDTYIIKINK